MGLGHGYRFSVPGMFTHQRGRSQIATQVDVDDGLIDRMRQTKVIRIDNNFFFFS